MSTIWIANLHSRVRLGHQPLKRVLLRILKENRVPARGVNLVLAGDSFVRRLNWKYFGKNCPTDVIAFPDNADNALLGEIVISLDQAGRQARARNVPLKKEVLLLVIHGFLHLLGEDDLSLSKWVRMKKREFENLVKFLCPR